MARQSVDAEPSAAMEVSVPRRYLALDGSLTELCGVLSPCVNPNGVRGIEMTWYDSSPSAAVYRP